MNYSMTGVSGVDLSRMSLRVLTGITGLSTQVAAGEKREQALSGYVSKLKLVISV
jgi:hypothetical protein